MRTCSNGTVSGCSLKGQVSCRPHARKPPSRSAAKESTGRSGVVKTVWRAGRAIEARPIASSAPSAAVARQELQRPGREGWSAGSGRVLALSRAPWGSVLQLVADPGGLLLGQRGVQRPGVVDPFVVAPERVDALDE